MIAVVVVVVTDSRVCLICLMVAEKTKVTESNNSAEMQSNSQSATDEKQESHTPSNNPHIEVPVGSLSAQDTSIVNQPDEQYTESHRSEAGDDAEMCADATVTDHNFEVDNNDNVSEKELNVMERQEEVTDGMVPGMSVLVRSGIHVAEQMSVACGENASEDARNIRSETDIKPSSPLFQYSSDAAATGLYDNVCQKIKSQVDT